MTQISLFDGEEKLRITKPIRLIELFAGYGSQSLALKYLGVPFEHHKICEWAIPSIQAYKDLHATDDNTDYSKELTTEEVFEYLAKQGVSSNYNEPMTYDQIKRLGDEKARTIYNNIKATNNLVSVCNAHGKDFEITDRDKYCYVLTYSFPCFTADSLVLTKTGYKKIVDIIGGDEVLGHDNKYHKVTNTFDNGFHTVYSVKGMGIDEIKATSNHKFYVREMYRKGHRSIRCFKEPIWKEVKDLTKNDYLGVAINTKSKIVENDKLPTNELLFWWLIGRYLGDGWVRSQGGIIICCDKDEVIEITTKLALLGFNYCVEKDTTVTKIHIPKKALGEFVEQFGRGASNKHLTQDIIDLPIKHLQCFLDGYLSADGCHTNGIIKANSVSRELIYGIAQCVAKAYNTPYRIYKVNVNPTKLIQGRVVNQKDWYQLCFKTEKKKQDKAFYENGYIWYPIKEIVELGEEQVYDIEVEDAHSFTVQNTIVHNCQDLSKAGKGMGMAKDSGTRSGLLWEVERILDELSAEGGNLPHILLMENVPDVIGSKNISHFADWVKKLDSLGYTSKWQCMNAKNYGVPQNRDRCFMVSWLGNYYYDFPQEKKLTKRLKDVLETEIDEKYYLSRTTIERIQSTTYECGKLENRTEKDGVMPTLCARDYKDTKLVVENETYYTWEDKQGNINTQCNRAANEDNCALTVACAETGKVLEKQSYRIRKLTPKECGRLMGVKDEDIDKMSVNQSNSKLYHLYGDSIVVDVLMEIFGEMI